MKTLIFLPVMLATTFSLYFVSCAGSSAINYELPEQYADSWVQFVKDGKHYEAVDDTAKLTAFARFDAGNTLEWIELQTNEIKRNIHLIANNDALLGSRLGREYIQISNLYVNQLQGEGQKIKSIVMENDDHVVARIHGLSDAIKEVSYLYSSPNGRRLRQLSFSNDESPFHNK